MKKHVFAFLLPLVAMTLASCVLYNGKNKDGSPKGDTSSTTQTTSVAPTSSGSEDPSGSSTTGTSIPPTPTGSVNLYLVLGPNGSYKDHTVGDVSAKFLENTYVGAFEIGKDLPGKDEILTSVTGSSFSHWIDRETTNTVSKVPAQDSVLVAVFEGGEGGNTPTPSPDMPNTGFGFLFDPRTDSEGKTVTRWFVGQIDPANPTDPQGRDQYKFSDINFVQGDKFVVYDFGNNAGWVDTLEDGILGGNVATYLEVGSTCYTVKQSFTATNIWLKIAWENNSIWMDLKA